MSSNIGLGTKIARIHNHLSDYRAVWFPFLFLKPKADVEMSQKRILAMTLCFGIYGVLFLNIRDWLSDSLTLNSFLMSLVYSNLVFFAWFQLVTSRLWNIRARQLQKGAK